MHSFPGGKVVESLPANAGDTGSSPGPGRSHMPRSHKARAPQLLSQCTWSPCSATREATAMRSPRIAVKSSPRSLQLEKAHAQQRRPNAGKNKLKKKKIHKDCWALNDDCWALNDTCPQKKKKSLGVSLKKIK